MFIPTQFLLRGIIATALEDPLINSSAERAISIFVWFLIFALAGVVGLFNRRLEYAIVLALVSSIITMAFFVIG